MRIGYARCSSPFIPVQNSGLTTDSKPLFQLRPIFASCLRHIYKSVFKTCVMLFVQYLSLACVQFLRPVFSSYLSLCSKLASCFLFDTLVLLAFNFLVLILVQSRVLSILNFNHILNSINKR